MNYWNSTIRIKEGAKRLSSKTPMKRSAMKRTGKPMKKVGRRTANWRKAWRFLKPELEKRGRTGCEFRFVPHVCEGPLDPAHSKKRNKMRADDIYAVAICCRSFHDRMEMMPHDEMERLVNQAIANGGGMIVPEAKAA